MMSTVDICHKILCWLRNVKRLIGNIFEGVNEIVPVQECKDASKERLDLIGWRQTNLWTSAQKFDRGSVQENTKRRSKVRFTELYPLLSCSLQCHLLKLSRCLSQS